MSNIENKSETLRELLARDHRELDGVFDALSSALRADAREDALRLWGVFEDGLCRHMAAEEKDVLPLLQEQNAAEAEALLKEHGDIRAKLAELGIGVDLHEVGALAVEDFISQLRTHAQREEALAYRWAEEHVPAQEQQAIRAALGVAQALRKRLGELARKARARVPSAH
jgi:hemerythrin-like domain-containing protein